MQSQQFLGAVGCVPEIGDGQSAGHAVTDGIDVRRRSVDEHGAAEFVLVPDAGRKRSIGGRRRSNRTAAQQERCENGARFFIKQHRVYDFFFFVLYTIIIIDFSRYTVRKIIGLFDYFFFPPAVIAHRHETDAVRLLVV